CREPLRRRRVGDAVDPAREHVPHGARHRGKARRLALSLVALRRECHREGVQMATRRALAAVVLAFAVAPLSAAAGGSSGGVAAWGCVADTNGGQCTIPAEAQHGVVAIAAGPVHSL